MSMMMPPDPEMAAGMPMPPGGGMPPGMPPEMGGRMPPMDAMSDSPLPAEGGIEGLMAALQGGGGGGRSTGLRPAPDAAQPPVRSLGPTRR